jgi:hypothetical protein
MYASDVPDSSHWLLTILSTERLWFLSSFFLYSTSSCCSNRILASFFCSDVACLPSTAFVTLGLAELSNIVLLLLGSAFSALCAPIASSSVNLLKVTPRSFPHSAFNWEILSSPELLVSLAAISALASFLVSLLHVRLPMCPRTRQFWSGKVDRLHYNICSTFSSVAYRSKSRAGDSNP